MSFLFYLLIFAVTFSHFGFCFLDRHYPEKRYPFQNLATTDANDTTDYLLPRTLSPTYYDLTLQTFLDNSSFSGVVVITFTVVSETDVIVLSVDTNYIPLTTIAATLTSNTSISIVSQSEDTVHQMVSFQLSGNLTAGVNETLSITYTGVLAANMLGYYLSSYNTTSNSTNTTHLMSITQFESTYARQAFPCFDEPAFRAEFLVKMYRSSDMNSFGNMPLNMSTDDTTLNLTLDTYEVTPSMPTYLVAFGVSDLPNITNGTLRLFAREAALVDGAYVMSVGQAILDNEANFIGVAYPLPKMDLVAVPDFDAGAMENWGLNTYREKYLLYNSTLNTWREKFLVMSVVAHEFAHQWFGDLVTPAWWDYSWLNEAFATYFEYTSNQMFPSEYGSDDSMYIILAVQEALDEDTGTPRPMTSAVYTPDAINGCFDYVIYEKGGSVLRMTENFLTTAVWKDGLNRYITANEYGTGTPEELFTALQAAATSAGSLLTNVNDTLQGWTTQGGYPLITVTLASNSTNSSVYTLSQVPYNVDSSLSNQTWNVPLTYTVESDAQFNASLAPLHWLLPSDSSTQNLTVNGTGWVIFNVNQQGYFRVNYDADNWSKLKAQLDSDMTAIGSINRAQIVDDALHLARTGEIDYTTAFGMTSYLVSETEPAPWNAFFVNIRYLLNQFYGTTTADGIKTYAQNIMSSPFATIMNDLDTALSTYLGSYTVWSAGLFACEIGLSECTTLANEMFVSWQSDIAGTVLVPEVKQTVFCVGLSQDTSTDAFTDVFNYYLNSNNGAEKLTVMNALGCTSGEDAINMYLDEICDTYKNNVRRQDRWIAIRGLVSYQTGITSTLNYLATNFAKVYDAVGDDISSVMSTLASTVIQSDHITLIESIVSNSTVDQTLRTMLNTTVLPAVATRQAWTNSTQGLAVQAWVTAYTTSAATSPLLTSLLLVVTTSVLAICSSHLR